MTTHLSRQDLAPILQNEDLCQLDYESLVALFREEEALGEYAPDGVSQTDPRSGERIVYSSARARRPHDNRPDEDEHDSEGENCVICRGDTTGVVDVAELSEGFTFINKNLYPILYPHERSGPETNNPSDDQPARGLHFLQWTSSYHDRDWHNLSQQDRVVVMQRLALLEARLLETGPRDGVQVTYNGIQAELGPVVSVIKNGGPQVGGSLSHGHQQIAFSNVIPRRTLEDWSFEATRGETFSTYLQRENPDELLIRAYGQATLLVPHFMRRPYDMILLVNDTAKRHLHDLDAAEIGDLARGWYDAIRAIHEIMPRLDREIAYNVVAHTGPGAGIYFEFLPYTQETGGFEHLGLSVCQADRHEVAKDLRGIIKPRST
jgi:galactose-1-phosphate uridylyltransferase